MAKGKFSFNNLIYSDTLSTNDPLKKNFDYKKEFNVNTISTFSEQRLTLAVGDNTISLPATTANIIYLETDQPLSLKFNGNTADDVVVSPSSSGNLDNTDGIFFKKGNFTSLIIKNQGSLSANCLLFIGA